MVSEKNRAGYFVLVVQCISMRVLGLLEYSDYFSAWVGPPERMDKSGLDETTENHNNTIANAIQQSQTNPDISKTHTNDNRKQKTNANIAQ